MGVKRCALMEGKPFLDQRGVGVLYINVKLHNPHAVNKNWLDATIETAFQKAERPLANSSAEVKGYGSTRFCVNGASRKLLFIRFASGNNRIITLKT